VISVLDGGAQVFTRLWCGYELYLAFQVLRLRVDVYTASPGSVTHSGGHVEAWDAVGITDGLAEIDEGSPQTKAHRESRFPGALVQRAADFAVERAEVSEPADRDRILHAIGSDGAAVDAAVRARYALMRASVLLCAGPSPELRALCESLQQSRLLEVDISVDKEADPAAGFGEASAQLAAALPLDSERIMLRGMHAAAAAGVGALLRKSTSVQVLSLVELVKASAGGAAEAWGAALGSGLGNTGWAAGVSLREIHLTNSGTARLGAKSSDATALLGAAGGVAVGAGLSSCTALRELRIDCHALGNAGVAGLAAGLFCCSALAVLNLEENAITHVGAAALAESLGGCASLESLHMDRNSLGGAGAAALLTATTTLRRIHLVRNGAKEGRAFFLAQGLRSCRSQLVYLDMYAEEGDADVIGPLREAKASNPLLKDLEIQLEYAYK
jgi:hypothetical protein